MTTETNSTSNIKETIYEYYLRKKNAGWKEKLRENLIKAIDNNQQQLVYCSISEGRDYERIEQPNDSRHDYTKFELVNRKLLEVVEYIKEQGLNYDLNISCNSYANSTFYDECGVLRIYWG